jgi:hypothetical protein
MSTTVQKASKVRSMATDPPVIADRAPAVVRVRPSFSGEGSCAADQQSASTPARPTQTASQYRRTPFIAA